MKSDIWMPLYWGDYARATGHLNATMHGAYMMLTKHYWCTGEPLPDDDAVLWRVSCCDSPDEWGKIRATIAKFFQVADGLWRHKRIDRELLKAVERAETAHARGVLGAKARHSKSQSQSHSNSSVANATGADAPQDPVKALFDEGVKLLTENGCKEPNARSIIAKWRKEQGDEPTQAAIKAARAESITEPIAWITQRFAGKTRESWNERRIREGMEAIRQ